MFRDSDRRKCEELCYRYYAGRKFSRTRYQETIHSHVRAGDRVLDAGCGHYLEFSRELSSDVQVVGIDLEEKLDTHNKRSPYAVRGDLEHLPFPSDYFNVVISRNVVEHLQDPVRVFREFHRVLKPGGKVIISTPNKWDYVSVIATLTPYRVHRRLVSKIFEVSEDDVFPTLYRANTLSALSGALRDAGFRENELHAVSHYPAYLMFSPVLFRLGVLYEKLTGLHSLRFLRGTLLCVFEKHPDTLAPDRGRDTGRPAAAAGRYRQPATEASMAGGPAGQVTLGGGLHRAGGAGGINANN
jgi:ubiquinone/menaquinone biosynthesis C-methylase UbiE